MTFDEDLRLPFLALLADARGPSALSRSIDVTGSDGDPTRELANDAFSAGHAGLIYRSAQQGDHDCVILFDPPEDLFRLVWRSPLSDSGGSGRRWAEVADRGARIPFRE